LNTNNKIFYKNQKKLKRNIVELKDEGLVYNSNNPNFIKSRNIDLVNNPLYFIYVKATLRGFHVNILDSNKKTLKHISGGKLGYKKAERRNLISLKAIANEALSFFSTLDKKQKKHLRICLVLNGFNFRRNRFVRSIINASFSFKLRKSIVSIIDITGLPHNGCRPKKIRRK
jgi:ribosomal protein S11